MSVWGGMGRGGLVGQSEAWVMGTRKEIQETNGGIYVGGGNDGREAFARSEDDTDNKAKES